MIRTYICYYSNVVCNPRFRQAENYSIQVCKNRMSLAKQTLSNVSQPYLILPI
jgi:hypothetical protein